MENFNLNKTYSFLSDTFGQSVSNSMASFFESNFKVFLASIDENSSLKENPVLKNELFYSCQVPIKNKQHITLRLSSDFIRIVFHDIFGSSLPVFDLEKLTELERKILNSFFEFIVKGFNEFIIKDTETSKIDPLNKTELNLVFIIKKGEINAGKLSITIPLNRFETKEIKQTENFTYDDFIDNFAYVNLVTGFAKISLEELKSLSPEDIIILEKSNIKVMTLKTDTITREIKVNPEPSIMLDIEDDNEIEDTENNKYKEKYMAENKTMWDDIQIEISAEFQRVKMSLGDLRQISKGLVIDVGPVMNNEISLLVENKAVAKGELVIINDKYGVKVTEVFASEKPKTEEIKSLKPKQPQLQQKAPSQPQAQPKAQPAPPRQVKAIPPKQQAPAKEDDFDYSNFEE